MSPEAAKQFIRTVMTEVIENMSADETTIAQYFANDYQQYVDGKHLDYDHFVKHMIAQKKAMTKISITVKYLIAEGDKVFSLHLVDGVKKDGNLIKAQVNALFQLRDNKIILCDELTHLIQGHKEDQNLGSRT